MRPLRVSQNFVPISDFKAQAAEWLRKVGDSGDPVVVTQNGKPAGVLMSPQAFDDLTEQARFVAAVQEGLSDADAGRVHSHADVVRKMKRRFGSVSVRWPLPEPCASVHASPSQWGGPTARSPTSRKSASSSPPTIQQPPAAG